MASLMRISQVRTIYDYNYWATHRLLSAAEGLSESQYHAPVPLPCDSLRGILVHTLSAEWIWRVRCQEGVSPSVLPTQKDLPTLADLRRRWQVEEAAMRAYLAQLEDGDLDFIVYLREKG